MSTVPYVPSPIFGDRETVIEQTKSLQCGELLISIVNPWLDSCFVHTKIKLPDFAYNDYKYVL